MDFGPVDDGHEVLEVVGAAVLVGEVVGVFPDIDAEQGDGAGEHHVLLVLHLGNHQAVGEGFVDEPTPARAFDGFGCGLKLLGKLGE